MCNVAQTKTPIKMARITTIDSLNKAWKVTDYQTSAQNLLNERIHLKTTGWTKVKLTPEFKQELCEMLANQIGGQWKSKNIVENCLKFRNPQHWALDRFFLSKYNKGNARISYCAGQDATWEMRQLRNELKKLY
tara:strand:+ start:390 stop:791 length:402 start_codon:yes stop_codon:yes gene_type:complete